MCDLGLRCFMIGPTIRAPSRNFQKTESSHGRAHCLIPPVTRLPRSDRAHSPLPLYFPGSTNALYTAEWLR